MFFEGIEITVIVKQGKAALDAECGDPAIDNFSDGESFDAELAIQTVVSTTTGMIASASKLIQIALPTDFPTQGKNPLLLLQTDQSAQGFIDNGLLGWQSGQFPCLLD